MLALLVPGVATGDPGLLALATPIGMWAPAIAAHVAGRRLRDGRSWTERLALTPLRPPLRPPGRLARQLEAVFGAFAAVAVATLLLGHALGVAPLGLADLSGYRAADPGLGLEEARDAGPRGRRRAGAQASLGATTSTLIRSGSSQNTA